MTTEPTEQRWLGIKETATAIGTTRASLDALKLLTKADLTARRDPTSPKKNKKLYDYNEMVAWLNFHIKLNSVQRRRLDAAAVVMIPPAYEGAV